MTPDEATNLIQVMSNKTNQLQSQNLLLEAKVMELSSKLEANDEKPLDKGRNVKTSNQSTT